MYMCSRTVTSRDATASHMATSLRVLRGQWLRQSLRTAQQARWQSSFAHLQEEMPRRKIQPIFDDLTPTPSYRLDISMADYLPTPKYVDQHPFSTTLLTSL